jgi:hypothetical protein
MANLTFQIPDERMQDLIDAWGDGWRATLPNGDPNPQTKQQYAKERIRQMIVNGVKHYESQQLQEFPIT